MRILLLLLTIPRMVLIIYIFALSTHIEAIKKIDQHPSFYRPHPSKPKLTENKHNYRFCETVSPWHYECNTDDLQFIKNFKEILKEIKNDK